MDRGGRENELRPKSGDTETSASLNRLRRDSALSPGEIGVQRIGCAAAPIPAFACDKVGPETRPSKERHGGPGNEIAASRQPASGAPRRPAPDWGVGGHDWVDTLCGSLYARGTAA